MPVPELPGKSKSILKLDAKNAKKKKKKKKGGGYKLLFLSSPLRFLRGFGDKNLRIYFEISDH